MKLIILSVIGSFLLTTSWAYADDITFKIIDSSAPFQTFPNSGPPVFGFSPNSRYIPVLKIVVVQGPNGKQIILDNGQPGFEEKNEGKVGTYAPIGVKFMAKSGQAFILYTSEASGEIVKVVPVVLHGGAVATEQVARVLTEILPEAELIGGEALAQLPKAAEVGGQAVAHVGLAAAALTKFAAGAAALVGAGAAIGLSPEGVGLCIVVVLTSGVGAYEAIRAPKGHKGDAFFEPFQKSVTVTMGYVEVDKTVAKGLYNLGKNGDSSLEGSYVWNAAHYDPSQDPIQIRRELIRKAQQDEMAREGIYLYPPGTKLQNSNAK